MAATILIVEGQPALEIPDAKGECWVYFVRPLPREGSWRCYRVERREPDEKADHAYVVRTDGVRWYCECSAFRFNKRRLETSCKHCIHLQELDQVLLALAG